MTSSQTSIHPGMRESSKKLKSPVEQSSKDDIGGELFLGESSKKLKSPIEQSSKDDIGGELSRLPQDVVVNILSRLSIKDLKQCMWVRNSWYQMIHSPYFIKIHHEKSDLRSTHTVSLMLQDLMADDPLLSHDLYLVEYELAGDSVTSCGVVPLKTKFKEMNAEYEFVGSSNGLICFSEPSISDPVYVCNPVIGEYITLPLTTVHPDVDIISGFGFDATTGKFKVIRMAHLSTDHADDEQSYNLKAEIYTLGSKGWRSIGFVPHPPRGDKPGVLLNGVLHWMCDRQLCPEEPYGIVCFDLASEEFSILPPPPGYGSDEIDAETEDGRHFEIKILKGKLCYFDGRVNDAVAWVMKEYGMKQSWVQGSSLDDLFKDFHGLDIIEGLPAHYKAFAYVPSLVSNRDGEDEPVGPEGYFNFEQWSKNLCAIPSPVCPHVVVPPNCPSKSALYTCAYARLRSSKYSQGQRLLSFDDLYNDHDGRDSSSEYDSTSSDEEPHFGIPETSSSSGSALNAASQNAEGNRVTPKRVTLDEFCKILGLK